MAIIVNDPANLPLTILQINLEKLPFLSKEFLDHVVKPVFNSGVKRDTYYIIKTNVSIQYNQATKELMGFGKLLNICMNKGFSLLMLKYEK